jgi:heme-degrading monooxygenase HmoA
VVRTVLEMTVREGSEEAFRAAWLETARMAAGLPGSAGQTLLQDPDRPSDHVIMADWADRDALEAFQRSPEREELSARLELFRVGARKRVLETVVHVPAHHSVER